MALMAPPKLLQILHLEDSDADHQLARLALRRAKLDCDWTQVDHLEQFCHLCNTQRFDIILADYRLPGFTAVDAWEQVQAAPGRPPFVLLSGAIGEAAAVNVMQIGMSDYLLKDDIDRLPRVITRAIEVHEARRQKAKAIAELAKSERQLAQLTEHLQTSIEQERAAIAREIHDDIGGALAAIRFDIAWIGRHTRDDGIQQRVNNAAEMLQHAIGASQRIMMNLRPPILEQGLVAAVQWLADGLERRTGISTHTHFSASHISVPSEVQVVAYRTAQEAITNIIKYAQASKVHIDLTDSEGVLTLEVSDNGCGIAEEMRDKPRAFGLKGLKERAKTVGGWLDISSRPGQGTSVILSVPLDATPPTGEPD